MVLKAQFTLSDEINDGINLRLILLPNDTERNTHELSFYMAREEVLFDVFLKKDCILDINHNKDKPITIAIFDSTANYNLEKQIDTI